jgi:hypothetical protein
MIAALLADGAPDGGTITQIAVLITALGGVAGAWRINRRDNNDEELKTTKKKLQDLQKDVLTLSGYIFAVRQTVASDHGITTPDPPRLLSEDWDK